MNPTSADILIAPATFKGTLSAPDAARIMADALSHAWPAARLDICPTADGGDDTLSVLAANEPAFQVITTNVTGPLPEQRVDARYLLHAKKKLIVIEAAQAHGIVLLPGKNPVAFESTSYGVGELIRHALQQMPPDERWTLVVTLGGSASTDGGTGALQAIGYAFLDARNHEILERLNGGTLSRIRSVQKPADFPNVRIRIATDVVNPLLGPTGCARVFAPQKGARAEDIPVLEAGLSRLAEIFQRDLKTDFENRPGAGAAGGLGFGLSQLPNAEFVSGADWIAGFLNLKGRTETSRLILTGEGRFDSQSLSGKGTGQLLKIAGSNKPVLVFCGQPEADLALPGNVRIIPLVNERFTADEAMANPEAALRHALAGALPLIQNYLAAAAIS